MFVFARLHADNAAAYKCAVTKRLAATRGAKELGLPPVGEEDLAQH